MTVDGIPTWVRGVAWLALATAPAFLALGVAYSKPEWACAAVALTVYGVVILRRGRRAAGDPTRPTNPA